MADPIEEPAVYVDELAAPVIPEKDYYPGEDLDGRERLDLFAGRFAARNSEMQNVTRPPEDFEPKPKPGAVQRSPFV